MKPLANEKSRQSCKRCNRVTVQDVICPACKNELIALYDNKLTWHTAYEIEKISRRAMIYSRRNDADDID